MKKFTALLILLSIFLLPLRAQEEVLVSIIYDNYACIQEMKTDWGFSCLVECGDHKLLFDAGNNSSLFQENIRKMGIDVAQIPCLFISHAHGDHTAGIPWIRKQNPSISCYLPSSLPGEGKSFSSPSHLYGPFYTTGDDFSAFTEQGLVIKTKGGGILITGCGHPGPAEMIRKAEKELNIQISTLIGGLHLMRYSDQQLQALSDELKKLGIEQICPTHCTGEHSIAFLKKAFGEGYLAGGTGRRLTIQP